MAETNQDEKRPAEGKAAATTRLTREGRWGVASARKDEIAEELKAGGMKRSAANLEAWKRMIREFPPLAAPDDAEPLSAIDPQLLTALPDSSPATFDADVFWTLNHLESPEVDYSSAPSKGCVALFRWAKRQPDKFVDRVVGVVTKAMKERKVGPIAGQLSKEDVARSRAHTQSIRDRLGMS